MGTEVPRRCPACRNCKECQFRIDSLTIKENSEYEVILSKLRLDVGRKRWIAGYPFNTMVKRLIDNYNQARGLMSRIESRMRGPRSKGIAAGSAYLRTCWDAQVDTRLGNAGTSGIYGLRKGKK
jgi:hypothetical protein